MNIVHLIAVGLLSLTLVLQSYAVFKYENFEKFTFRRLLLIGQHSTFSIFILSGLYLLYSKSFQVQHWFYIKVLLCVVLVSSLIKAFKVDILPVQRRAGIILAWIALIIILTLSWTKPILFNG